MDDDFCDADVDGIARITEYEASVGVTSICPATMMLAKEDLYMIMETANSYKGGSGAKFVGINTEGPFISEENKRLYNIKWGYEKSIEHNSMQGGVFGFAGQAAQRKISICRWNKAVKLIHLNLAYYKKHVKTKSCNLVFLPQKS